MSTDAELTGKKIWRAGTLVYSTSGLVILFCWLLWGDLAYQLRDRAFPWTLQLLLHRFHATDTMMGVLTISLPAVMVIGISPVISYASDRHRGAWGRRIPYLLWITPISVIAMIGLAFAQQMGKSDGAILAYLAIFSIVFMACDTICNLIFMALCNDVVPRAVIGRFFGLFRVVSLGAGMFFSLYLLKRAENHAMAIFLTMAVIYGVGFTAMCLRVREGEYPAPEDNAPTPWRATLDYLRDCFGHSYYRWLFASMALANMAFAPINGFVLLYAKTLNDDLALMGKAIAIQYLISLVQAYPLGWLADKIHPLRLTIISLVLFGAASLLSFYFVHSAIGICVALVGVGACAGWWLTANGPLCMALFPKIEFAQFYSAMNIAANVGILLVGYFCGKFLDRAGHDYRFIYLWAFFLTVLSFAATGVVYRKFLKLGGTRGYVAPLRAHPNEAV